MFKPQSLWYRVAMIVLRCADMPYQLQNS